MDTLTARPRVLKQANLAMIRRALKARGTATRAEIVQDTKISQTTVRSLLTEMLQNGEIMGIGQDASSGGRKAERYKFLPERYHSAAFCITDNRMHRLLVDGCGEIAEVTCLSVKEEGFVEALLSSLDEMAAQQEIRSVGIGVPGIVDGQSFWRKNEKGVMVRTDLGKLLREKYGVPVVLENDINATAIGFGRCYEKKYPREKAEHVNMAYLYFEKGCVSAGLLSGGRVIRGRHNFAGELGLIPMEDERMLDEWLAEERDDVSYVNLIARVVGWICGILNPEYVALGGPDLRVSCVGPIDDRIMSLLPRDMSTQIVYAKDVWGDYHEGMAYLTAAKMFDEVQLIRR